MPSPARERELTDALWERIRGIIPKHQPSPKGGRRPVCDRECLGGIVYVLRNGIRWNDLPAEFPSDTTCWRRMRDWVKAGIWDKVHHFILAELKDAGELDTSELFADATFAEARKGGPRPAERLAASASKSNSSSTLPGSRSASPSTAPTSPRSTSSNPPSTTFR